MRTGPIALGVALAERLQLLAEADGERADFVAYWPIYAMNGLEAAQRARQPGQRVPAGVEIAARHRASMVRDQLKRREA